MYNILCVDDISSNLLVLESLFEAHEDKYNIITACSGYEALEMLLKENIDLILLDVMMPDINGFETANLIKANKKTKNIPIIFLTAKKDDETIQDAFKYGVDYLSKPYDEFELFTRIEVQLKLVQAHKDLEEEIFINQAILNSQKNIIFIQDDNGIVRANQSFLDFFQVLDVKEFNSTNSSIAELFMEYENYFALNILNGHKTWCDALSKEEQDTDYNIMLMDTGKFVPKVFKIDVTQMNLSDKFVVTLSDITNLTSKSKKFENKATYDALTNIYNRSKFNDYMTEHYNLFKRYDDDVCFAIFDIDFFKLVNDNHGHVVGDSTLITFVQTIEEAVRNTDIFARWGGEEFTLLLPKTKIDDAYDVVEKLRILIENVKFKTIGQKTCSIGITQFKEDDTIDAVLIRADEGLYEAKESGRNKVCIK